MSAPPKNFSVLEIIFALMLVSGFLLAIHYVPHEDHAFESVQMIMRDVGYGWLVRYLHMNGASFMFIALYVNMFRGIYHGSFKKPGEPLWITGVVILFMTIVCAFTGYVLALSQMGGWAATVITGMFTAVPFIGESLKETVLGGDSLGTATLTRFYAIHFTVPFLILLLVMTRIRSLRAEQPDIPKRNNCKSLLWPGSFMLAFVVVTFFFPETLSPSEHFLPYDPLAMPERIVPQWYLLPFYGMLRAVNFGCNIYIFGGLALVASAMCPVYRGKKLRIKRFVALMLTGTVLCAAGYAAQATAEDGSHFVPLPLAELVLISARSVGVLAVLGIFATLLLLPWLDTHEVRNCGKRPVFKWAVWLILPALVLLGMSGAMPAEGIWIVLGQIGMGAYFSWFLILLPLLSRYEAGGK